jgi:hypothetical protein
LVKFSKLYIYCVSRELIYCYLNKQTRRIPSFTQGICFVTNTKNKISDNTNSCTIRKYEIEGDFSLLIVSYFYLFCFFEVFWNLNIHYIRIVLLLNILYTYMPCHVYIFILYTGFSTAYLKTMGAAIKRSRAASAITLVKDNTRASIIYSISLVNMSFIFTFYVLKM